MSDNKNEINTDIEFKHSVTIEHEHSVVFTNDVFSSNNNALEKLLHSNHTINEPTKVLVFFDKGLSAVFPELEYRIENWFTSKEHFQLSTSPIGITGGESTKNKWEHVENIWSLIDKSKLCRHSYIIAVGGGAFLDLLGFASSTAHRGIRFIRIPTTTLAQCDSGVGVKNAVNYLGKKNWVGTFNVPHGVINDSHFLTRLPLNERRSGIIEAIKVALIKDSGFFKYFERNIDVLKKFEGDELDTVIRESAKIHFDHITLSGDPFENGSSRPLDFGHWAAHKLESMSEYTISHGEAVAIGIAIDVIYSEKIGLLSTKESQRILSLLEHLDYTLYSEKLEQLSSDGRHTLLDGLHEFREHIGGALSIPLLSSIGSFVEVNKINDQLMNESILELKSRFSTNSTKTDVSAKEAK